MSIVDNAEVHLNNEFVKVNSLIVKKTTGIYR